MKQSENNEKPTCATCKHIGQAYWGSDWDYGGRTHFCLKRDERRSDAMKPTGDFAQDFMDNFRTFFDAKAHNAACRYYENREPAKPDQARVLKLLQDCDGKIAFGFFSEENRICEGMSGKFVERDEGAARHRHPSDGTRDWKLTRVGKVEAARVQNRIREDNDLVTYE